MSNLQFAFEPLGKEELTFLDEFLLNRLDHETLERLAAAGEDEGIVGISELDGFLTAVVSGPNLIEPSKWLRAMWGKEEPAWKSMEQFEEVFLLLSRHQNSIAGMLLTGPTEFEPMFAELRMKGHVHINVEDWCHGYMRGVYLDAAAWFAGGDQIERMLYPLILFGTEEGWRALDSMPESEQDLTRELIPRSVVALNAHWLSRRSEHLASPAEPIRRASPKIGRNDPCPCGSAKKYKHCCLQ
ncbi:MAG TPA: UPF0149 family protein [Steroidobacteraceae bacterium]|nr:UPF0149 family protein [Steroidobacteraceae bacterium]